MDNETFKITEYDQRRLIIDLLVRLCIDAEINRDRFQLLLSAGRPHKLAGLIQNYNQEYKDRSQRLREIIYRDYGHIDINDFLPPGESSDNPSLV